MTDTTSPQPADLAARLEAVLTARFTELGNPFSRMRIAFQGADGWPASKEVGPHDVAEVLRELLAAEPAAPPAADWAALSDADRKFLTFTFALDLAADQMASRGDEFDADDEDAMERLRRLADEEQQAETQAHPAEHTWAVELRDPLAEEWAPGTRYVVRERAVEALDHARRLAPTWTDGTPTERRLVRATTTYTVEATTPPAVVAEPGKECAASISGNCLAESQSETACDTEDGECVHAGQPGKETGRG